MKRTIAAWTLLLALVVRIPFDFRAGDAHFGPGEYVVSLEGGSAASLTIRSTTQGPCTVVRVRRSSDAARGAAPTVSLRAYGDLRFLAAIQVNGGARWEIDPSTDETALTRRHGPPKVMSLRAISRQVD